MQNSFIDKMTAKQQIKMIFEHYRSHFYTVLSSFKESFWGFIQLPWLDPLR